MGLRSDCGSLGELAEKHSPAHTTAPLAHSRVSFLGHSCLVKGPLEAQQWLGGLLQTSLSYVDLSVLLPDG